MTEIQAVLCGYYGKGNGGDEALLVSMLEMLPPTVKPLVLSANPRATAKSYGVKSYDRMNSRSVVRALKESQVLILGGGSLIQDATSLRNSIYYGGLMGLARQFGLKTIAIAQGIGPVDKSLTRWIAKRAFSGCSAISVGTRLCHGSRSGLEYVRHSRPRHCQHSQPENRRHSAIAPSIDQ
jgi:polysaccharide pyruvyl transferase CsaB